MAILNIRHWFQKRESALSSVEVAREQMSRFNALLKSDPKDLTNAISSFDSGYLAPLAHLIEEYERRDDKMKTCSMKMKASVGRCDYSIQQKEGFQADPRAARHAEILKRFWSTVRTTSTFNRNETGGFNLLKKQMMDAQSYGYAIHELVWTPTADGELRAEFIQVPLWHFENRTGRLRFLPHQTCYNGIPMNPGEWMVTTGDGVGIAASLCACMKRMGLVDWMIYNERCGMPLLHGSTGAAFKSDQWNNLNAAIKNIARYSQLLTDSSTKIEAIPLGGGSSIPYPQLIEWCDRAIAALYRGADLSTIAKGGDGVGASLQGDESDMLEQDACGRLSDTLNEAVDRFVIRYVTGDDEPLARIVVEPVSKPNVDTDIKIDQHLVSMGVKLSKNDALQRYGRCEADPNDAEDAPLAQPSQSGGAPWTSPPTTVGSDLRADRNQLFNEAAASSRPPYTDGDGRATSMKSPQTDVLSAFASDTGPAAEAIKELLKNPSKEAAEELLKNLPYLLPEDPALAAVIAEEMAKQFSTCLPNEVQRVPSGNGNGGQFTGKTNHPRGKEPETKPKHDRYGSTDTDKLTADPKRNAERGSAAIKEVMRKKSGFVDNAMYRPEVGWIRFEWGDAGNPNKDEKGVTYRGGHGLSHIDAKGGHDVNDLPPVIANGEMFKHENPDRIYVLHGNKYAVLRKLGKGHKVAITEFNSSHEPKKLEFIKNQPRVAKPGEK